MSRYNRYPVSGMTNVQIYTGTVSIQYRDTTTYRYTAHSYIYVYMYVCLAGAVRNGELGIPWRFSDFHIFGKMNSIPTSSASFKNMPHF